MKMKREENSNKILNDSGITMDEIVTKIGCGEINFLKELLDKGLDINVRDKYSISLLHWAVKLDQKEIINLLLSQGLDINTEVLENNELKILGTPLHVAVQCNNIKMVKYLIENDALMLRDNEGLYPIHRAAQKQITPILAYLLAQEVDVNITDDNGLTPLMWAAKGTPLNNSNHNEDVFRLLLAFGADIDIQDWAGDTALHYAIEERKDRLICFLSNHNASLDIPNKSNETVRSILTELKNNPQFWISTRLIIAVLNRGKGGNKSRIVHRCIYTLALTLLLFTFGEILSVEGIQKWAKWTIFVFSFACLVLLKTFLFTSIDNTIAIYFSTVFWMTFVWFYHFMPCLPLNYTTLFSLSSLLLWSSFLCTALGDPGIVANSQEKASRELVHLINDGIFSPSTFCNTCLCRRPIRSKHCAVCNHCVAKYDHHCPWIANCVGLKNFKVFIFYLVTLLSSAIICLIGSWKFWSVQLERNPGLSWLSIHSVFPFVTIFVLVASLHLIWVTVLLFYQMQNIVFYNITTNERLFSTRYDYVATMNSAKPNHCENLMRFCGISCCGLVEKDTRDWMTIVTKEEAMYPSRQISPVTDRHSIPKLIYNYSDKPNS